ncbi:MAG: hypothetical protein IJL85_01270 [Erysipelotrichaceae bacterium]|nr:hypothetical protein [Erysipelotrichaceae bacterium]
MTYLLERFEKIYDALYECPEIDDLIHIDDATEKEFMEKNWDTIIDFTNIAFILFLLCL